MNIREAVFAEIINRAEVILESTAGTSATEDTRTDQQKQLDKFFSTRRFCEHHSSVIELIGILTGRKPQSSVKVESVKFSILYCTTNKRPWMVLTEEGNGFAALECSRYHNECGCERTATLQEASAFLDEFKKLDPEKFYTWCKEKLDSTRWMLDL